jgi:hypothetical protein
MMNVLYFYFSRKTTSHFPHTAICYRHALPRLRFFPEAAIEVGFLWTFEPTTGPYGDAEPYLTQFTFLTFTSPVVIMCKHTLKLI